MNVQSFTSGDKTDKKDILPPIKMLYTVQHFNFGDCLKTVAPPYNIVKVVWKV